MRIDEFLKPGSELIGDMVRTKIADGKWLWEGGAGGVYLGYLTSDPDLRPSVRVIDTPTSVGAEMVDQDGKYVTHYTHGK